MATLIKPTTKTIGSVIRLLRKERGLTQVQLADAAGLKQPVVSDLEAGASQSIENLVAIAIGLGMNLSDLIGAAEKMENATGAMKQFLNTASTLSKASEEAEALFRDLGDTSPQ
jgi:transcriptional regulator with XRE-family HTH domain